LDVEAMSWTRPKICGQSPGARTNHTAVLVGHCIYFYGGCNNDVIFDDLFYLDTLALRWHRVSTNIAVNPGPRRGHISFLWQNYLFIHGGNPETIPPSPAADPTIFSTFLPPTNTACWHRVTLDTPSPCPRAFHAACVVSGGMLVIQGGTDGTHVFSDFWSLDLTHRYGRPRFGHSALALGHFIHFLGGSDGTRYVEGRETVLAVNLLTLDVQRIGEDGPRACIGHAVAGMGAKGYWVGGFDGREALGGDVWIWNLAGSAFLTSVRVEFAAMEEGGEESG
ncbi:hypothetical protein BC829DRAFT_363300, partial [Chytridium lagenaria]